MTLSESITQRIEHIAQREGRTPESLLQDLLDDYEQRQPSTQDSIEAFIGAFDDDVDDLSVTVHETLRKKFEGDDGTA